MVDKTGRMSLKEILFGSDGKVAVKGLTELAAVPALLYSTALLSEDAGKSAQKASVLKAEYLQKYNTFKYDWDHHIHTPLTSEFSKYLTARGITSNASHATYYEWISHNPNITLNFSRSGIFNEWAPMHQSSWTPQLSAMSTQISSYVSTEIAYAIFAATTAIMGGALLYKGVKNLYGHYKAKHSDKKLDQT